MHVSCHLLAGLPPSHLGLQLLVLFSNELPRFLLHQAAGSESLEWGCTRRDEVEGEWEVDGGSGRWMGGVGGGWGGGGGGGGGECIGGGGGGEVEGECLGGGGGGGVFRRWRESVQGSV